THNLIGLWVRLKLMSLVALRLYNRMIRFDVSVFIRCFGWNSLVNHDKLVARFLEQVANKLWTVVRTYDRLFCLVKEPAFHKRFLRDLHEMFRFARQSNVIGYYGAVKHV